MQVIRGQMSISFCHLNTGMTEQFMSESMARGD